MSKTVSVLKPNKIIENVARKKIVCNTTEVLDPTHLVKFLSHIYFILFLKKFFRKNFGQSEGTPGIARLITLTEHPTRKTKIGLASSPYGDICPQDTYSRACTPCSRDRRSGFRYPFRHSRFQSLRWRVEHYGCRK